MTNQDDIRICLKHKVDYLGFIFYEKSPRYISPQRVAEFLKPFSQKKDFHSVGIFVKTCFNEIRNVVQKSGVDDIQMHGGESLEFCSRFSSLPIKVFRLKNSLSFIKNEWYHYPMILLEGYQKKSYGGTGKTFDWNLAVEFRKRYGGKLFLSGGLNPNNISFAVQTVSPDVVDVCSGVEKAPGIKDHRLIEKFIFNARNKEFAS